MDTINLIKQAHMGDKNSRDQILIENTPLIWSIVKRFLGRGYEGEDLFQIGCIGMLKAIDRFDVSLNLSFSTYAVPLITGEIRRFLRDDGIIKISRTIKENQNKILLEKGQIEEKENREPTIEELSVKCDISKEDVVIALNAMGAVQSIDKEIAYGNSEKKITLGEKIEDKTQSQEKVINKLFVKQILETLEEKEKTIIVLRYFKNKTQSEIASKLGLTQVQISRLEKKILKKLRAQVNF